METTMDEALERHRLARRWNGFPLFDRETDEITGFVDVPNWKWDDLTETQRADVMAYRDEGITVHGMTPDAAHGLALAEYGIDCPHKWEYHEPIDRRCVWCFVMEPLPGRVVTVGDRRMRLQEPLPPLLKVPRPPAGPIGAYTAEAATTMPTLEYDEYEWTGTRYVKVSR